MKCKPFFLLLVRPCCSPPQTCVLQSNVSLSKGVSESGVTRVGCVSTGGWHTLHADASSMIYVIVVFRTCWSLVFNGLFGSFSNSAAWHGLQLTIEIMQVNQIAANELTHVLVCRYTFINPSDLWHTHTHTHFLSWQLTAVWLLNSSPACLSPWYWNPWCGWLGRPSGQDTRARTRAHVCVCVFVCVCAHAVWVCVFTRIFLLMNWLIPWFPP